MTWFKDDVTTTIGVEAGGEGVSLLKDSSIQESGRYRCAVDFGSDYSPDTSQTYAQFARSVETGVTGTQYAAKGDAVTHTCIMYGDRLSGDVIWTNSDGALTGPTYTQSTGIHSSSPYSTSSSLVISAVTSDDATTFTCTGEYAHGSTVVTGTIVMEIYHTPGIL